MVSITVHCPSQVFCNYWCITLHCMLQALHNQYTGHKTSKANGNNCSFSTTSYDYISLTTSYVVCSSIKAIVGGSICI